MPAGNAAAPHYTFNLMSLCPRHAWGGVKAMLHSVFDQIDADAVHAQYDKLLDRIETSLPEVHDHLDAARADVLAFTAFPKAVWRPPRTTLLPRLHPLMKPRFPARARPGKRGFAFIP
ncbi:hypothetical protein GCM10023350_09690 [Nocardioides endophyticus]|uniref:Mutator family transposase n=1 Tax=Nocardioides endophyticus TaxID=1353775 RepID=A0ABP8YFK5_9ACTN